MFYIYTIYNRERDKIYIGQTADLGKRLKRHNGTLLNSKKAFTSKNNGMWELIYKEDVLTRKEAIKRERELKSYRGREFVRSFIKK
jgi:putative endonuclease